MAGGYRTFDFGRFDTRRRHASVQTAMGCDRLSLVLESVPTGGTLETSTSPTSSSRLHLFTHVWQRLPLGIANLLGPHVIRHIV